MPLDYYNDNDLCSVLWLRQLVKEGHLPPGTVNDWSIEELRRPYLEGCRRVHLFAGIGGWALALELAGWPQDEVVWTGSCPCQPFSVAGKQQGEADARHLWPDMLRHIKECRPPTVFGEQVASKLGRAWLTGVRADLEALGYAVGAADLYAASIAPHARQRLYWVADSDYKRSVGGLRSQNMERTLLHETARRNKKPNKSCSHNPDDDGWEKWVGVDGECRRIESGTVALVDDFPERMGLLRGYGNAIVPQLAAVFIKAFIDAKT